MTSIPDHDIYTEILEWSKDRPGWQRDALRRLFAAGDITSAEIDDLAQLAKAARGLAKPLAPQVLTKEHLATKSAGGEPISLVSLTHHRGANALAAEQTVTFGPGLTIVYGQNAAGKSGYARILKQACRSRFTEKILGNVLGGTAPAKLRATIRFREGTQGCPIEWAVDSPPSDALAAVSVFDAACAPVYLRDKTDVAFRPFGLDIFDTLADLCGEVRKRLESEKTKLSALAPNLPMLPEGTKAKALVDSLTALTNADDVRSLATLSSMEHERLDQLRAHQGDLLAANPKQRAKELTARAERIELLARHIAGLFSTFRGSSLDRLRSTTETLRIAQAALAILRKTTLTPDLLLGTGEDTWRKMWEAAEAFSEVAYPESSSFPVLEGGARCPFCQQTIGEKAEERLRHFGEYVSSAAQAQVREAESAQKAALATVTDAVIARPEIDLAITELNSESPALAKDVQDFLKAAGRIQKGIGEALAQGIWFLTNGVTRSPEADLRTSATSLRERAKQLLVAKPAMALQDAGELSELEARTTFSKQLQPILNEIERKRQLAAYDQCIRDAATQAITRKSTELTTRLVTEQLQAGFRDELERLEFNHLAVEIQAAGGRKGELFHRLAFTNAPGIAVTHVLSEGESRTLSLASFLTELRTATNRDAIIFDDPVSSLDELWRERIARRLVSEAGERQVIVFTHDLLFLRFLIGAAKGQEVPCAHQYVRREDEIGLCSADLPWIAMSTNDRIARLRNRWQSAEKTFRTARGSYELDGRDIYGLLREAWERATTEVLLNDVVERYRHSIETQKVRLLHDITEDDYKTLEAGMAECSRWARGHDRPAADGTPFPEPEALKKRIDDLEGWVKAIRRRRKR